MIIIWFLHLQPPLSEKKRKKERVERKKESKERVDRKKESKERKKEADCGLLSKVKPHKVKLLFNIKYNTILPFSFYLLTFTLHNKKS